MVKEEIDTLNKILETSEKTTPDFINGIIIPYDKIRRFYECLERICRKAIKSEEYWERIQEGTKGMEKMNIDFINGIIDGKIKLGDD